MDDKRRVFIVGPGRSGTSLLRTILNRHPEIAITPETHFLDIWKPRLFSDGVFDETRWGDFKDSKYFKRLELDSSFKALGEGPRTLFAGLISEYARTHRPSACIGGEKTPAHHHHIATLLDWFPSALILFCSRDPRGVVASYKTLDETWAENSVVAATRGWKQAVSSYTTYAHHPRLRLIPFEHLLSDTKMTVEPLLNDLGLEWTDSMLESKSETRRFSNDSLNSASPIDSSRTSSWKGRLSKYEVAVVESMVVKEMDHLGYDLLTSPTLRRLLSPIKYLQVGAVRARNIVRIATDPDLRARRANATSRTKSQVLN